MTLKAYQNAQARAEDPRATEYRLFGQVTGALLDAKAANAQGTPLVEAIDWNRRLWRTLAADCMDDRNTLTQDVRAKIISLSLWVSKYSRSVTREKAPLDPLIEINRTIMQGLQPRPARSEFQGAFKSRRGNAPAFLFISPPPFAIASAATGISPSACFARTGKAGLAKARCPLAGKIFPSGNSCLTGPRRLQKYPSKINDLCG